MMKIQIKTIEQTCESCPSQWEGWTDDNRQIYIRYRFGYLRVSIGPVGDDDEFAAVSGEEVFGLSFGGEYDGHMTETKLRELTAEFLFWPKTR